MKNAIKLFSILLIAGFMATGCKGPIGSPGKDANASCTQCHNPSVVDAKTTEFELSKHSFGEAAATEAGSNTCGPCHLSESFKDVCKNNVASTFTLNATTGKYSNDYFSSTSKAFGEINCFTCHSNLHTAFDSTDFKPLTTTAAVSMTMYKGTKSINLTQDGGSSNLCIKCHQPRPLTTSTTTSNGDVVDYAVLASSPTTVFYDNAVGNAAPNKVIPSYRTHVHYGTVGAVYAGVGGVQFTGTQTYANSTHTTVASCASCHMSTMTGKAGGHSFSALGNFSGCNAAGCHTSAVTTSSTTLWVTPRTDIQTLLNSLATKINAVGAGTDVLHSEPDATLNLWAGLTTKNYDGYLNIYDPSTNPAGVWKNPAASGSWTTAQKATNTALPIFPSFKNVTMGSIINFQMCLRDYSLGIHNYKYTKALLQNSIEALTAAGY